MSIATTGPTSRVSALLGVALLAGALWDFASGQSRARSRASSEAHAAAGGANATDPAYAGSKPAKIAVVATADATAAGPTGAPAETLLPAASPQAPGGSKIAPSPVSADDYEAGHEVAVALGEAQMLLSYAANAGIAIGTEVTDPIAGARAAEEAQQWTSEIEGKFWPALSRLAAAVKPVTTQSLIADEKGDARRATNSYFKWTIIIGAVIVPISFIMFVNTGFSDEVEGLIKTNDAAAIVLHDELLNYRASIDHLAQAAPPRTGDDSAAPAPVAAPTRNDLVEKLAQFARVSRHLFARAQIMDAFILWREQEPTMLQGDKPWWADIDSDATKRRRNNLELEVQLGTVATGATSLVDQGFSKLATYQDIRAFAKSVQQWNLVIYGAITAYLLPIAYSLLGACAFALRNLSAQTKAKSYQPSSSNRARIVIALIAGTVVGLFNSFTNGVSVSPLAVAFLVGYAVEVFFSFLDAFVQTFRKVRAA